MANGHELVSADGRSLLDTTAVIAEAEEIVRLHQTDMARSDWIGNAIVDRSRPMLWGWPWVRSVIVEGLEDVYNEGVYQVGPMPHGSLGVPLLPTGPSGTGGGWQWVAFKNTGVEEETLKFLQWLNLEPTEQGHTRMGEVLTVLGSVPVTYADLDYNREHAEPFMIGFMNSALMYESRPLPNVPGVDQVFRMLESAVERAVNDGRSIVDTMNEAHSQLQAEFARRAAEANE